MPVQNANVNAAFGLEGSIYVQSVERGVAHAKAFSSKGRFCIADHHVITFPIHLHRLLRQNIVPRTWAG